MVQGQPGKKVGKTPSQPVAGCGGKYLSSELCEEAQFKQVIK
jgi:hypothetical protein